MDPKWFPPPNRPIHATGLAPIGGTLIGVASLLLPQGRFRNVIAVPSLLWLAWKLRQGSAGSPEEDYMNAVNLCMAVMKYIDFVVMRSPEQSFHRVRPGGTVEDADEVTQMSLWQKFKWSLSLACTTRGIGWNWRVKNVERVPEGISRRRFVLQQIARAGVAYLFLDISQWYLSSTPFGVQGTPPNLFDFPLPQQFLYGWLRGFQSGFTMSMGYYILAAIAVGTGLQTPEAWPPIYGSFLRQGYTIRNIWGRCWHQFLRRTFETSNSVILSITSISKGTLLSRYLQLYNAFLVSALIHHAGSLNMEYSPAIKYQFLFFVIQPVAITAEDFAIYLGKKAGFRDTWKTRAIGYVWTWTWLGFSLRYAAKYFFDIGLGTAQHPLVSKFSIVRLILGK